MFAVGRALVSWPVGAKGALRRRPPRILHDPRTIGLTCLRTAGADVIPVDIQPSPRLPVAPGSDATDKPFACSATPADITVFSRAAIQ